MADDDWNRQAARTASGGRGNIRYGTDRDAWSGSSSRPGLGNWGAGLRQQYRDTANVMGIKRSYARNGTRSNNRNGDR